MGLHLEGLILLIQSLGLIALILTGTAAAYQIAKFYAHRNSRLEVDPEADREGLSVVELEKVVRRAVTDAMASRQTSGSTESLPDPKLDYTGRIDIPDDGEYNAPGISSQGRPGLRDREA